MRRSRWLLIALLVVAGAAAIAWLARRPLTEAAVDRWFAAQGVAARYRITALSPSSVTLAAVSLGPAARPEFTAERVEATVGWSPLRPRIAAIRLVKPRLRATLSGGGISFGSLDRLIPASVGPRALPDIDVTIVDGDLRLGTPAGLLRGAVEGAGRLGNGFQGRWRLASAILKARGCTAGLGAATVTLATTRDAVRVAAAGASPEIRCAQGSATVIDWRVAATLPPALDRYAARFDVQAARFGAGRYGAQALVLAGDASASALDGPIAGRAQVKAERLRGPSIGSGRVSADGPFQIDPQTGAGSLQAQVAVSRGSARLDAAAMPALEGTLAQPLYAALLRRATAAARSFDATASVRLRTGADLDVALTGLIARAASGAEVRQTGRIAYSAGVARLNGGAELSGGGLPSLTLTGAGSAGNDGLAGSGSVVAAPWAVPGAAVHAFRIAARSDGGSAKLTGLVTASGALGAGITAQRLSVPIDLAISPRGDVVFGARCVAIAWARLARDTLAFGPGDARVCPAGPAIVGLAGGRVEGRATVDPLRLRGRLGNTPLSLAAAALRLTLTGAASRPILGFAPTQLMLSHGDTQTSMVLGGRIDIASASGAGIFADAGFADAGMPVTMSRGGGWRFASGRLALADASVRITDKTAPARFEPLHIAGISAALADGEIDARGTGYLASTGARLFGFTARHGLASGQGTAAVETGTLRFGPDLQPYQITEALRGVVDNVAGPVDGNGRFAWTGSALTSRGTLAIDHVSLATAALGPVDDIAGTLEFDDLLALTTPPRQRLTIKRINPGVAVEDGVVHVRMLGPDAAMIESIVWPYAGGILTVAPVTVRAGDTMRSFTLTVDGLDAEQFLQKFEIKDLNVTGRFDGRLPLVFADGKGRIAGGTLVARAGGGLVQYVGAVGGADTGAAARLAFDALRRLRYDSLAINLDGDLDGELVTQLRFAGTNEAEATLGGGPLPIRATGLPFRFNIDVRAPFRALLGTASSFSDVRPLLRAPAEVQPQ